MSRTLLPGVPYPLGAKVNSLGTNFALYSENASGVSVCFFDESGKQTDCIALKERTAFVWHGLIKDVRPGQMYGYRVEGTWEPEKGRLFNPAKLLEDLKTAGKKAAYLPDADAIVDHVSKNIQGGDIICVFSNGGFGGIHGKLLERLGRR